MRLGLVLILAFSIACGSAGGPGQDSGAPPQDAGASLDAGLPDSGTIDGGVDAGIDGGADAGIDGGADAGVDAGIDAGVDAGADAGVPPCDPEVVVDPPENGDPGGATFHIDSAGYGVGMWRTSIAGTQRILFTGWRLERPRDPLRRFGSVLLRARRELLRQRSPRLGSE